MDFQELITKAVRIKQAYNLLNRVEGGKKWKAEEYLQGLFGDVGDLSKLLMAKKGFRFDQSADYDSKLARELADCLWSIVMIAEELDIDLEKEFSKTLTKLENKISDRKVVRAKKPRRPVL
jgi:NTP pyrophosphatase (non-canonical NTP hydrolase)